MGLNELLGGSPDLGRWFDDHSNAIMQAGFGLATQRGLGGAAGGLVSGTALDTADVAKRNAEKARQQQINGTLEYLKTRYPDLAQAVMNGYPISQAWDEALKRQNPTATADKQTTDIQNYEYGLTHPGFAQTLTQKGGASETALTPTYGTQTDWKQGGVGHGHGRTVMMQLNKAGQSVPTQMPPGVQPMSPVDLAANKATATGDAKTAVVARAALPGAEQAYSIAQQALSNFDPNNTSEAAQSVRAGEGEQFSKILGIPTGQLLPEIGGTHKANFRNLVKQLSGDAFLQIRQALKGAGQVTDYEGQKGEIALSRMAAASQSGDEAAFKQALFDFTEAIDNGMKLLRDQAKGDYQQGAPAVTNGPGGVDDLLTKYGVQ